MADTKVLDILKALQTTNGYISLAVEIGGVVVPLVKGLVKLVRNVVTGEATLAYEVVVQTGQEELDRVVELSLSDLAELNAELVRQGQPPLVVPEGV